MAEPGVGTLIRLGAQDHGAFAAHGLIDQQPDALGETFGALLGEELHDGVEEVRIFRVGHECWELDVFLTTPRHKPL